MTSKYANWNYAEPQYPHLMSGRTLQAIRIFVCLLPSVILLVMAVTLLPVTNQIFFFTQYGNQFVIFSSAASLYLARSKNHPALAKWTAIVTQLALPMQLVVTLVYWLALHHHVLAALDKMPVGPTRTGSYILMVFIHFWPFVSISANVFLSRFE